ncbi:hypothetical protein NEOLEDRAFT_1152387 [Neolentinus lepideus HHB14362 ss-1]|uniref:HAT C-terminal dimerisation domain-containing protein n=1 Tax=Neolentinus lepideus HHB14362 ss-1 TaxID=1314782 RepID=A0A165MUR4_9AGAM|nr:hypothetical protein NEOLEDRAFT_1152387 [Neolentinus lepideus HHB14362 ss-1]
MANITQANSTQLDVILVTLANLYLIFSSVALDSAIHEKVLESLKKCWAKMDQERCCFNPCNPVITAGSLWQIIQRQFKRMFDEDLNSEFEITFTEYVQNIGECCDAGLDLEGKRRCAQEMLDTQLKNGRNGLVKLAMRTLSIVPNSATMERSFGDFRAIQTKQQSHLAVEKAQQSVLIKVDTASTYSSIK